MFPYCVSSQSGFTAVIFYLFLLKTAFSHTITCSSIGGQDGACVLIESCPLLQRKFEEGRDNPEIIKLFQTFTLECGFHINAPKICCPVEDAITLTSTRLSSSHSQIRPLKSPPYIGFLRHENFKLIPPLEYCSLTPVVDRVTGGTSAPLGSYPWLARVGYKVSKSGNIFHGCSGTIINNRYILTAGHCVEGIGSNLTPVQVRLGEHDITKDPDCTHGVQCTYVTDIDIERIIVHPQYTPGSKQNDICLLRLRKKIPFDSLSIQPVCLPFTKEYGLNSHLEDMEEAVVAGWGKTKWNKAEGSSVLQHVKVPIVPNEDCQKLYTAASTTLNITPKQLCAGGEYTDSCDGDSGGALTVSYYHESMFKTFQIGVVAFGPSRCGTRDAPPGVYTKVKEYLKWILDSIEP